MENRTVDDLCFDLQEELSRKGRESTARIWIDAAISKRIKTRKLRGKDLTKVWIEKE